MSRTHRNVCNWYVGLKDKVLNNEVFYPIEAFTWKSTRNKDYGKCTDWDKFFGERWIHGYDGGTKNSLCDPSSHSPKGYLGGWTHSKIGLKRKSSKCARTFWKKEIKKILCELY